MGRPVSLTEMKSIDLVVTGCVGVGDDGTRLGKGVATVILNLHCFVNMVLLMKISSLQRLFIPFNGLSVVSYPERSTT